MNTQQEKNCIQEDEIDLRELFNTLYQYKVFIISFTIFITLIAAIYAYTKTPIYEVKSNVQIGYIGNNLIDDSAIIVKKLNIIFNIDDKPQTKNKFISEVSSITTNKKLNNFIEIKTQAITNDDSLKKNKEVVCTGIGVDNMLGVSKHHKMTYLIHNIENILHGIHSEVWNGTEYLLIEATNNPFLLDWDDNNRARFVVDFNIYRKE